MKPHLMLLVFSLLIGAASAEARPGPGINQPATSVPEPGTWALLATGTLVMLVGINQRR
jgi:hypothetical protein